MTARRDFLRGLVALPMVGGAVTLIGQPSAVAEVPTWETLEAYKVWLDIERRALAYEMSAMPERVARYRPAEGADQAAYFKAINCCMNLTSGVGCFHQFDGTNLATDRAALVMSTVGCDWREASR